MIRNSNLPVRASIVVVIFVCIILEVFFYMYQSYNKLPTQVIRNNKGVGCGYIDHFNDSSQYQKSNKTRVFFIFGTRPEIIKMSPVIQEFEKSSHFLVIKVFTGQHADLIKPFLTLFEIKVDIYITNTMTAGQSISSLVGKMMLSMELCITLRKSDIWMVQGDTSSAFAVATVAFNRKLRVGHIEAGLRTYNMYSPFPEEFNRRTLASIVTFHFAPTQHSRKNLIAEGVPNDRIYVTGNTVIDAVKILNKRLPPTLPNNLIDIIERNHIVVLITMHRRENIAAMSTFYDTIQSVSCANCRFIVPVHPNPDATKAANTICLKDPTRFICVPPLSYQDLHLIMRRSQFIMTDSGGLQEEATWYHKPIVVLREDTERMEAVDAGVAVLIGRDYKKLRVLMAELLQKKSNISKAMSKIVFPFGYGNASQQILTVLLSNEHVLTQPIRLKPPDEDKKTILRSAEDVTILSNNTTVALVLQVFKRNTLASQLECARIQTLKPKTVVVFQNGFHVDVSSIINEFRDKNPDIEIQHVASSKNARYHGGFHIGYMMTEEYISVWDDDVLPKRDWIRYCIDYSQKHGNALVGANGRSFAFFNGSIMHQNQYIGRNDFVGHTWTLLRKLLRYYIELKPLTFHTGEDIQLAFALQKAGIEAHNPMKKGDHSVLDNKAVSINENVSFPGNISPRQLLFCKILKAGFKAMDCKNCNEPAVLDECIRIFKNKAAEVEKQAEADDTQENDQVIWMAKTNETSGDKG